jgi:tRNA/rRNA methyltransferase
MYIYSVMQFTFVLVEPAVPGNIGAAARAIKTMGFSNLRLVNPCDHLAEEALMLAHGSHDILEGANVFSTLDEALDGLDLTVATTAKKRQARLKYSLLPDLADFLAMKGDSIQSTGIVFGREESGLSNDEIRMCDIVSSVPLSNPYPSLNLGQAVMLYAYTLSGFDVKKSYSTITENSNSEEFRTMMDRARQVLDETGFPESPALYNRLLERLAWLDEDDIHLVLSVLKKYSG